MYTVEKYKLALRILTTVVKLGLTGETINTKSVPTDILPSVLQVNTKLCNVRLVYWF